jgi:hypothetical protein
MHERAPCMLHFAFSLALPWWLGDGRRDWRETCFHWVSCLLFLLSLPISFHPPQLAVVIPLLV